MGWGGGVGPSCKFRQCWTLDPFVFVNALVLSFSWPFLIYITKICSILKITLQIIIFLKLPSKFSYVSKLLPIKKNEKKNIPRMYVKIL